MNNKTLMMLGAVGIIAGSIMPWATITSPLIGTLQITGLQGDGIISLIVGGFLLLGALAIKPKPGKITSPLLLLFGIILLLFSLWKLATMLGVIADTEYVITSIGTGLWILLLGSVLFTIGAGQKTPDVQVAPTVSATSSPSAPAEIAPVVEPPPIEPSPIPEAKPEPAPTSVEKPAATSQKQLPGWAWALIGAGSVGLLVGAIFLGRATASLPSKAEDEPPVEEPLVAEVVEVEESEPEEPEPQEQEEQEPASVPAIVDLPEIIDASDQAIKVIAADYFEGSATMVFIGVIENISDSMLNQPKIVVNLRDENGDLVASGDATAMLEELYPGDVSPYQIFIYNSSITTDWTEYELIVEDTEGYSFKTYHDFEVLSSSGNMGSTSYSIKGEIENIGNEEAYLIEVIAICYDSEGNFVQVSSGSTTLETLGPGSKSPFEMYVITRAEEIDSYEILVQSAVQ